MPINPSALGGTPEEQPPVEEPKTRTRRTKAQMIADAVVPANDEQVDLKDAGTGATIQRPWLVAVEMVRDGKAEWADKAMKYALMKFDQQKAAPAFEPEQVQGETKYHPEMTSHIVKTGEEDRGDRGTYVTYTDIFGGHAGSMHVDEWNTLPLDREESDTPSLLGSIPPDAEVGDEVSIGADTFRVGHNRELIDGSRPISVDGEIVRPARRWRRELGAGVDGPWESVPHPGLVAAPEKAETNGKGDDTHVETLPAGVQVEQISEGEWKIGTGVMEKIGLPDYSSLQIGPITASRLATDDGRRTTVQIGNREASIPTAVVEVAQEAMDIVEYIARYQRGELVSFLESTGALKQPVS